MLEVKCHNTNGIGEAVIRKCDCAVSAYKLFARRERHKNEN